LLWHLLKEIEKEISKSEDISRLVNLNITKDHIAKTYEEFGLNGNRFIAAVEWTVKAIRL
jgi:hypothetical protein